MSLPYHWLSLIPGFPLLFTSFSHRCSSFLASWKDTYTRVSLDRLGCRTTMSRQLHLRQIDGPSAHLRHPDTISRETQKQPTERAVTISDSVQLYEGKYLVGGFLGSEGNKLWF